MSIVSKCQKSASIIGRPIYRLPLPPAIDYHVLFTPCQRVFHHVFFLDERWRSITHRCVSARSDKSIGAPAPIKLCLSQPLIRQGRIHRPVKDPGIFRPASSDPSDLGFSLINPGDHSYFYFFFYSSEALTGGRAARIDSSSAMLISGNVSGAAGRRFHHFLIKLNSGQQRISSLACVRFSCRCIRFTNQAVHKSLFIRSSFQSRVLENLFFFPNKNKKSFSFRLAAASLDFLFRSPPKIISCLPPFLSFF